MRTLALIILAFITNIIFAQNKQLKIQTGSQTINYPSYLEAEVLNENNDVVFNTNDLMADGEKIIDKGYTLKVYTYWGNGKDIFDIEDKTRICISANNSDLNPLVHELVNLPLEHLLIVEETFSKNEDGQYDAEILLEDGIVFNYNSGQVSITQNEKPLLLLGKYVVKTTSGFLKISYNPENKYFHYEVTDTYEGMIVQ